MPHHDLSYYIHDGSSALRLQLSGDFSGDGVRQVEQTWKTAASALGGRTLIVDLSCVKAVDDAGRELLGKWQAAGAHIIADSPAAKQRIESLTSRPVTLVLTNPRATGRRLFRVMPRWASSRLLPGAVLSRRE